MHNIIVRTEQYFNKGSNGGKNERCATVEQEIQHRHRLICQAGAQRVGGAQHNLGSWLDSREKIKFKSAHNTDDPGTFTYQSGGTGVIIRGPMTQYANHGDQDLWKLERYCTYMFCVNPSHKYRGVASLFFFVFLYQLAPVD